MYKNIGQGRVAFKQGKLTNVLHSQNKIEIETSSGVETIDYDVLAISTGGSKAAPWFSDDEKLPTQAERD